MRYRSIEQFSQRVEIYRGSVSTVYQALLEDESAAAGAKPKKVILKSYHKAKMADKHYHKLHREIVAMAGLKGPYVAELYGTFEDPDNVYLVMEFCEGGDLFKVMMLHGGRLDEHFVCVEIITPLLRVLEKLHAMDTMHRDIKPENIFLTRGHKLRLGDFGLALNFSQEIPFSRSGTLDYMAPEVLRNPASHMQESPLVTQAHLDAKGIRPYTTAVDVWAAGILAYELVCGKPPFEVEDESKTAALIMYSNSIRFPSKYSSHWADFIRQALIKDPNERPPAAALLQHPWIQSHIQQAISTTANGRSTKEDLLVSLPLAQSKFTVPMSKQQHPMVAASSGPMAAPHLSMADAAAAAVAAATLAPSVRHTPVGMLHHAHSAAAAGPLPLGGLSIALKFTELRADLPPPEGTQRSISATAAARVPSACSPMMTHSTNKPVQQQQQQPEMQQTPTKTAGQSLVDPRRSLPTPYTVQADLPSPNDSPTKHTASSGAATSGMGQARPTASAYGSMTPGPNLQPAGPPQPHPYLRNPASNAAARAAALFETLQANAASQQQALTSAQKSRAAAAVADGVASTNPAIRPQSALPSTSTARMQTADVERGQPATASPGPTQGAPAVPAAATASPSNLRRPASAMPGNSQSVPGTSAVDVHHLITNLDRNMQLSEPGQTVGPASNSQAPGALSMAFAKAKAAVQAAAGEREVHPSRVRAIVELQEGLKQQAKKAVQAWMDSAEKEGAEAPPAAPAAGPAAAAQQQLPRPPTSRPPTDPAQLAAAVSGASHDGAVWLTVRRPIATATTSTPATAAVSAATNSNTTATPQSPQQPLTKSYSSHYQAMQAGSPAGSYASALPPRPTARPTSPTQSSKPLQAQAASAVVTASPASKNPHQALQQAFVSRIPSSLKPLRLEAPCNSGNPAGVGCGPGSLSGSVPASVVRAGAVPPSPRSPDRAGSGGLMLDSPGPSAPGIKGRLAYHLKRQAVL